jgi:hypothetical protein
MSKRNVDRAWGLVSVDHFQVARIEHPYVNVPEPFFAFQKLIIVKAVTESHRLREFRCHRISLGFEIVDCENAVFLLYARCICRVRTPKH